ncbi:hypothetical protein B4135_1790 [Caldibacillus debilis]|uniref:Uncharacterized protein n=1 Tax=Caldibacillus debilis TaxID=301148 RepID=A0A150M7P0_9BACI|nr:hypothetical protein B4135_1790 [Caldibacillus debilis]
MFWRFPNTSFFFLRIKSPLILSVRKSLRSPPCSIMGRDYL